MDEKSKRRIIAEMKQIWDIKNSDFMGYELGKKDIFTYHHLIIPKRDGGPVSIDNGAILCGQTAHPYLHVIEMYDRDRFLYLTKLLIVINKQRYLPTDNQLRQIDFVLKEFEKEYSGTTNKKGYYLIKDSYTRRLIHKKEYF